MEFQKRMEVDERLEFDIFLIPSLQMSTSTQARGDCLIKDHNMLTKHNVENKDSLTEANKEHWLVNRPRLIDQLTN